MKKKVIIISICLIIIAGIIGIVYLYNLYDKKLVNPNEITTDSKFKNVTYNKVEKIENDTIGILTIEKIGLKATVKEGSNDEILKNHIGHLENTAIYDGNVGLVAHNRGYENSYFARINELKEGDIVSYKTRFYTRDYKIDNIVTILETDWKLLKGTKENKITLITCVPNKKIQRLCVQATEMK